MEAVGGIETHTPGPRIEKFKMFKVASSSGKQALETEKHWGGSSDYSSIIRGSRGSEICFGVSSFLNCCEGLEVAALKTTIFLKPGFGVYIIFPSTAFIYVPERRVDLVPIRLQSFNRGKF